MLELVLTIEASGGIAPIVSVLQLWMSVDKRCIREKLFKVNLLSKLEMLDFVFWQVMYAFQHDVFY